MTTDWNNETVTIQSIPKPTGVPDLVKAGLWYDHNRNLLYLGFAGRASYINNETNAIPTPWPPGVWQFRPDGDASGPFNTTIASTDALWDFMIRPCSGVISYGAGKGYVLHGASSPDPRDDQVPAIGGMIVFDYTTETILNNTITGTHFDGGIHMGGMLYLPNYGAEGIFIVIGGEDQNLHLLPMNVSSIYDPSTGKWYQQPLTGDVPNPRKAHCISGAYSMNGTFEMLVLSPFLHGVFIYSSQCASFLYGGWSGRATSANMPFDEIHILTLPAFQWYKVQYPPLNPRHTVTCHSVGGGQILTIGGLNSDNTEPDPDVYLNVFEGHDPFAQGLNVFDLSTLWWKDQYTANPGPYVASKTIMDIYAKG